MCGIAAETTVSPWSSRVTEYTFVKIRFGGRAQAYRPFPARHADRTVLTELLRSGIALNLIQLKLARFAPSLSWLDELSLTGPRT
jgi:hypothetical protein